MRTTTLSVKLTLFALLTLLLPTSCGDGESLAELDAFPALTTVKGWLLIVGHQNLETINGFNSLQRIEEGYYPGSLIIKGNPQLREVKGFPELEYIDGDVIFEDNPNLPRCEIERFVAGIDTITGEVIIQGNGSGSCD